MNLKSNFAAGMHDSGMVSIHTNDSMFDGISIHPGMDFLFVDLCHLHYIPGPQTCASKAERHFGASCSRIFV